MQIVIIRGLDMESAMWYTEGKEFPHHASRAYIGDESCPLFLKEKGFIKKLYKIQRLGKEITLTVPLLTSDWFAQFEKLIKSIECPIEISVNDYGALFRVCEICKETYIPVIGRLLSRQITDPIINSYNHSSFMPVRKVWMNNEIVLLKGVNPNEELVRHWKTPHIFSKAGVDFLKRFTGMNNLRFEIDFPLHGLIDNASGISASAHITETILTMGNCSDCTSCPSQKAYAGKTRAGVSIFRRKNCYFYECDLSKKEIPHYVNRVVTRF